MAKQVTKEQKIEKLLSLFTPSDVYNLKDLEKLCSKVGLRSQLIKDLVTECVNDNLIQSDKIGVSTYYWKFPVSKSTEITRMETEKEKLLKEIEILKQKKESLLSTRNSENRNELIKEYKKLTEESSNCNLPFKYQDYVDFQDNYEEIKNSVNTITEDIFSLQTYVCDKFGMNRKDFDSAFGIKDDFDTI